MTRYALGIAATLALIISVATTASGPTTSHQATPTNTPVGTRTPVLSLLATVLANATGTAEAKAMATAAAAQTADAAATRTAAAATATETAEAIAAEQTATAQQASIIRAATEAAGNAATATAGAARAEQTIAALSTQDAELQVALVTLATAQAEAAQMAATAHARTESAEATIAALATALAAAERQLTAAANPTPPTPTLTPTPTPTPTPVPEPGTVLYEADGFDDWRLGAGWQAASGMLLTDGTACAPLYAPYAPGAISNYAVEAEIDVVELGAAGVSELDFGLIVRAASRSGNDAGYFGGLGNSHGGIAYQAGIAYEYVRVASDTCFTELIDTRELELQEGRYSFRLEAKANVIRLLVNGRLAMEVRDNRHLSGGRVGVFSNGAQIAVLSFRVIAL